MMVTKLEDMVQSFLLKTAPDRERSRSSLAMHSGLRSPSDGSDSDSTEPQISESYAVK